MTGTTEAGRERRRGPASGSVLLAVAALVAGLDCLGCATGAIRNVGRRVERPLAIEAAYTDGERLWLAYRGETRNAWDAVVDTRRRAVTLSLEDLDPRRQYAVDELPLERIAPEAIPRESLRPLPLRNTGDATAPGDSPYLLVAMRDGRPASLRPASLPSASPDAVLHADALVRREVAAWTWAGVPLTAAWDLVAVPPFAIFAVPFFVLSE